MNKQFKKEKKLLRAAKRKERKRARNTFNLDKIKSTMRDHDISFWEAKYYIRYGTNPDGMTPCEMGGWCHCDGSC